MQRTIDAPETEISAECLLARQLLPRIRVEERFVRAGGKINTKSLFRRYEKRLIAPCIRAGLQVLRLYQRGREHALHPVVRRLELTFPDLPHAFDGFRVLHLSDLHIDGIDGLTENLASLLDGIDADLCVMTGDYRYEDDGRCEETYRRLSKLLPTLAARHGIYGILGNHDESCIAFALEEMGVRMLINEAIRVERGGDSIWLVGIDDPFDYKCDDLPGAMAQVPAADFKILLAHTPDLYQQAFDFGVRLYLCGHTHGGQIRVPKIGALRSNAKCPRAYTYRHWNHRGMEGYTSGGIGCSSLPVRLNCPPEVAMITLRAR